MLWSMKRSLGPFSWPLGDREPDVTSRKSPDPFHRLPLTQTKRLSTTATRLVKWTVFGSLPSTPMAEPAPWT